MLVRVCAAAVNSGDYRLVVADPQLVRGLTGLRQPTVAGGVCGQDLSGVVEAVGAGAEGFAVGDEVVGWCKTGGAQAELAVVPTKQLVKKPKGVTHEAASTIPMAAITALEALRDIAALQKGDRVLVVGASGGVGMFAVQMARSMGAADVVAVCSARNVELCKGFGASECIDYTTHDWTKYEGDKFDVIVFMAGKFHLRKCLRVLKRDGRVAIVGTRGFAGGLPRSMFALARNAVFRRRKVRMFLSKEDLGYVQECVDMLEAGQINPVIQQTLPLSEGPAAYDLFQKGAQGKIVITMGE